MKIKELLNHRMLLFLAAHVSVLGLTVFPESPIADRKVVVLKQSHGQPAELHLRALRQAISADLKNSLAEKQYSIVDLEQVAWCQKTDINLNPPVTIEEVVIVAEIEVDKKKKHLLCFLERIPLDNRRWWQEWHYAGHRIYFIKPKKQFESQPSDERIKKFLAETNFGNREFRDNIVVGTVVCFESKAKLVDSLSRSLDDKSRNGYKETLEASLGRR